MKGKISLRIAQLTQKTNQFNLTTKRYTEHEIEQFISDGKTKIYSMFVKDKFGDNGLTGLCIIRIDQNNAENAIIDTLLMSCRVIGRNIEYVFVNYIIQQLQKLSIKTVTADFYPTKKNSQVELFYDKLKFDVVSKSEGGTKYFVNVTNFEYIKNDYIKINEL